MQKFSDLSVSESDTSHNLCSHLYSGIPSKHAIGALFKIRNYSYSCTDMIVEIGTEINFGPCKIIKKHIEAHSWGHFRLCTYT